MPDTLFIREKISILEEMKDFKMRIVHVGVVTGGEVVIVLEGVTVDVCVQLPGDVVYEGVVIPQAVHVVSIDESNFKEGLE